MSKLIKDPLVHFLLIGAALFAIAAMRGEPKTRNRIVVTADQVAQARAAATALQGRAPTTEELAELCVDQPSLDNPFCASVTRDPDTGFIIFFTAHPDNVAKFRTAGLDVALDYRISTDKSGDFQVQLAGNYLDRLEFVSTPGAEVDSDLREQYFPQYSATLDASWSRGPVTVAYGLNWFSKTDRFTSETLAGDPDYSDPKYFHVKPKWEHDINVAWDVTESVNLYAGVNNLFDEKPAFGYSSYPVSAMGRYFYLGARVNFGVAVK